MRTRLREYRVLLLLRHGHPERIGGLLYGLLRRRLTPRVARSKGLRRCSPKEWVARLLRYQRCCRLLLGILLRLLVLLGIRRIYNILLRYLRHLRRVVPRVRRCLPRIRLHLDLAAESLLLRILLWCRSCMRDLQILKTVHEALLSLRLLQERIPGAGGRLCGL